MKLDRLIALADATRHRCEEQQEEIRRARLGPAADDVDYIANEILPLLESARPDLDAAGISLSISRGFGPGTRNEPTLELVCRLTGKWPDNATHARGHRVTIKCRKGLISSSSAEVHTGLEIPLDYEGEVPLTPVLAAQMAIDHAVTTLMADAELKAAPQPTRGLPGNPSDVAIVIAR